MKTEKLKQFFTVSNAIENVEDVREVENSIESFKILGTKDMNLTMKDFHRSLNHLNAYCEAGKLRDYNLNFGVPSGEVKNRLTRLFLEEPIAWEHIKKWHISFERIHPFGDGNGRTGRFLMLLQAEKAEVEIPEMFFDMENFEENRRKYYQWFK